MFLSIGMLKQKYFLADIFILSAEKQPIIVMAENRMLTYLCFYFEILSLFLLFINKKPQV
mgnify:CR=1 FL=1